MKQISWNETNDELNPHYQPPLKHKNITSILKETVAVECQQCHSKLIPLRESPLACQAKQNALQKQKCFVSSDSCPRCLLKLKKHLQHDLLFYTQQSELSVLTKEDPLATHEHVQRLTIMLEDVNQKIQKELTIKKR